MQTIKNLSDLNKAYADAKRDKKEAEKKQREESAKDNVHGSKSHKQIQDEEMADNSFVFAAHNQSLYNALDKAYAIRDSYRNHLANDHDAACKAWEAAGRDFFQLQKNCVASMKSAGKQLEPRNTSYESQMMKAVTVVTADDMGIVNKWKDTLKKKWHDVGYNTTKSDADAFDEFLLDGNHLSNGAAARKEVRSVVDKYFGDDHLRSMFNIIRPERSTAAEKMKKLREQNDLPPQEGASK